MEPHERIRLETLGGEVIAYFAPNAETNRSFDNAAENIAIPDSDSSAVTLDFGSWTTEITLQGFFESSDGLPDAHVQDLQSADMFDTTETVTARDQMNRLLNMTVYGQPGPYALYNEGNEYTAQSQGGVDVASGVYPAVIPTQIRPALNSGESREAYTIQLISGVES